MLFIFLVFSSLFGMQNSKSTKGQIKYLVYCMENAILNLPPEQEQMVWLIDFQGFNMSHISIKVTRETAHVLQDHYPERLGLAILYNPPKIFEPFFTVSKFFRFYILCFNTSCWIVYKHVAFCFSHNIITDLSVIHEVSNEATIDDVMLTIYIVSNNESKTNFILE